MKKIGLILLILVLLILATVPGLIGYGVKQNYPAALTALDESLEDWQLGQSNYSSGWLSSQLDFQLVPVAGGDAISLNSRIHHGLIPGNVLKPGLASIQSELLNEDRDLLAQIALEISLSASANLNIDLKGDFQGQVNAETDRNMHQIILQLSQIEIKHGDIDLTGINGRMVLDRNNDQQWQLAVDLSAATSEQPGLDLQAPKFNLNLSRDDNHIAMDTRFGAARMTTGTETVQDLDSRLNMEQLHAPTLVALVEEVKRISEAGYSFQQTQQQFISAVFLSMPVLLANMPKIPQLEVRFTDPTGPITAKGSVDILEPPPAGFMTHGDLILDVLKFEFQGKFPQSWALKQAKAKAAQDFPGLSDEQAFTGIAEETLSNLEANAVLKPEDSDYHFDTRFDRRKLTLNGQSMSLPNGFEF